MPRTKEQNEALRAERKKAILEATLRIYVDKGYQAAEIGEIAELAGVARGLVYYYYQDKKTLFRELFRHQLETSNQQIRKLFSRDGSVLDLFDSFAAHMYGGVFDNPEHLLFFFRMRHDLHTLFEPKETEGLLGMRDNLALFADKLKLGMERGEIRSMSPDTLSYQFWGALIHGVMQVRQQAEALLGQGVPMAELRRHMEVPMRDAVESCMSMLRPVMLSGKKEE